MTREDAEAEVAKLDAIGLYYAVKHACLHDVDPVWRDALRRATRIAGNSVSAAPFSPPGPAPTPRP
jgi:hypothetical protein